MSEIGVLGLLLLGPLLGQPLHLLVVELEQVGHSLAQLVRIVDCSDPPKLRPASRVSAGAKAAPEAEPTKLEHPLQVIADCVATEQDRYRQHVEHLVDFGEASGQPRRQVRLIKSHLGHLALQRFTDLLLEIK